MNSVYITTPIYYVNDKPHIGHAYTTIACDILTRYNKMNGKDVYFLTGTDEHGQKVEKAAIDNQTDPQLFVNKMSNNFKELVKFLNCQTDDFIRTTENRHKNASQALWLKLFSNDQIYLSNYEGWYSVRDEAFYSENELVKKNDKFIAPTGANVEWVKEESYFFRLSEWQDKLLKFYKNNPKIISPKSRYNEVISFIEGGLKDLSISRTTFQWGVPVPNNNKHVMYVWIDALCNYLTSIGYPDTDSEKFKKYWPAIHVVGKDILRFHAIYWPAFLMAADLEPPKKIFAHGWFTNEGQKISKSIGNIIDPYDVIDKYGLDQLRFYLFREVPFGNDGDFSNESILQRVNADLSNNFGNLIQRLCSFINKNCESTVINSYKKNDLDKKLFQISQNNFDNYIKCMNNQHIDKALKEIFDFLTKTNIYIDQQEPWKLKKTNVERMNVVLSVSIEMVRRATILLYPIMPESCEKIFDMLNLDKNNINFNSFEDIPKDNYRIKEAYPIFPRIE